MSALTSGVLALCLANPTTNLVREPLSRMPPARGKVVRPIDNWSTISAS
jgi:hypothetical protein